MYVGIVAVMLHHCLSARPARVWRHLSPLRFATDPSEAHSWGRKTPCRDGEW